MAEVAYLITARDEDALCLEYSLRSALAQTLAGEVLLVDDASSIPIDPPPPVRLHRLSVNVGISAARNAGLAALESSRYVAVFNCDVLLPEQWAEICAAYLDDHPECGAVWTGLKHARPTTASAWWLDCQEIKQPPVVGRTAFAPGHAVMFRRSAVESIGGYDPVNFPNVDEDHDICRRLYGKGAETHFIGAPYVASLQDVSLAEMARKDFTRMRITTVPTSRQIARVVEKGMRRLARHAFAGRWGLLCRDAAVGLWSIERAFKLRRTSTGGSRR